MNKASGGDGIPVELFQILKDDAVKVLHSICQQLRKTQQWPQDWKRSVFIPIPKKGNAKECSNDRTIALISHASKVMLKILQARLQQYVNHELPDVQAGFRKGRGFPLQGDKTQTICPQPRALNTLDLVYPYHSFHFSPSLPAYIMLFSTLGFCINSGLCWNVLPIASSSYSSGLGSHFTSLTALSNQTSHPIYLSVSLAFMSPC